MKRFTSPTQQTGQLGEQIAVKFLITKGFTIIDRNYTKKIGEIDIVALKDGILHFVEVKTLVQGNVSRETPLNPFENITPFKLKKFSRTVQWYLVEKKVALGTKWVIDAVAVIVSRETRSAKVEVLWNVVA